MATLPMPPTDQINPLVINDNNSACELCGGPAASLFGGRWICDDCYQVSGSCCAGQPDDEG